MKTITIQPKKMEDGTLPYPYHISEDGLIQRQDFWKGRPFRLIGFAKYSQINQVDLIFEDWIKKPKSCIGMYAVLEYKRKYGDGNITIETDKTDFATNYQMIESININDAENKNQGDSEWISRLIKF